MGLPRRIVFDGYPFCDYIPKPITSVSRSTNGLIAVSRTDGSIDVYDENEHFYLVHHIPSSVTTSVYATFWSPTRLFATGGDGRVFEFDLASYRPKRTLVLPGGLPIRCLIGNSRRLITGNDGGFVNIIDIENESFEIQKSNIKVEGKILSLAMHGKKGHLAVSDSRGIVHIFDLKTGSTLSTYSVGGADSSNPTVVWSLLFVGNSLFSGDSRGTVSVWDAQLGCIVYTFRSHQADILCLAVSKDHQNVFAAGIDPNICRFNLCKTGTSSRWEPSGIIRGNQRDVHSLVFVEESDSSCLLFRKAKVDHLIAGGNDSRLMLLPCPPVNTGDKLFLTARKRKRDSAIFNTQHPVRLPFWPLSLTPSLPLSVHYAIKSFKTKNNPQPARLCLVQHAYYMCLYRLPRKPRELFGSKDTEQKQQQARKCIKLAHIQPKKGQHIVTCCISPCGKLMAYSDNSTSRVLKIEHPKKWDFNPEKPAPLVTLSRLGWPDNASRRSRTPSTSSDNENDSEDAGAAAAVAATKFLALDQSCADLFVESSGVDEQLVSAPRKRKAVAMETGEEGGGEEALLQSDEASAMPPASLMAFTPSSRSLVTVDPASQVVTCRRLDTGTVVWSLMLSKGTPDGKPSSIHLLKMAQLHKDTEDVTTTVLLVMASLDSFVRVYVFCEEYSDTPQPATPPRLLFTCPRVADPARLSHHPRPCAIDLFVHYTEEDSKEKPSAGDQVDGVASGFAEVRASLAIIYTTRQLTEWVLSFQVPLKSSPAAQVELLGTPKLDDWLERFWKNAHSKWQDAMPRFHSLQYFYNSKILMLGTSMFCMTIDRRNPLDPASIKNAFRNRSSTKPQEGCCLRVVKKLKGIMSCAVLPDRVAALTLDTDTAVASLPAPMSRKRFGT